ncbi:MAG: class I SAM-dependent methyltransferase [Microcystaceae cyanobacterium]
MATIFRTWSYQYPWLYASVSWLSTLIVGGDRRFHALPLQNLTLNSASKILDLCCGGGQATRFLVENSEAVTGLDASPVSLQRARKAAPQATYVQAMAESLPFTNDSFDLVHTSVALHEMTAPQLRQILSEVYRVLKPGGIFAFIDLHQPTNPLFWPPLALFLWLFETETAWQLIRSDLTAILTESGFQDCQVQLHAGGSLQVIQSRK